MARRPHQYKTANLSGQGVGRGTLPAAGWRVKRKCAVLSQRGAWRARPGHPPSRYAMAGSGPGRSSTTGFVASPSA